MPTLNQDIISRFPGRKVRGRQGDEVAIISVSGHVFIVEGPDKERFSVLASDMNDIGAEWLARSTPPPTKEEYTKPAASTAPAASTPDPEAILKGPPCEAERLPQEMPKARKPTKKKTENQGNLF